MLRGICAVAIAVYHYLAWDLDTVIQSMGSFSVYAFFILSAVTMMIAYAGGLEAPSPSPKYKNSMSPDVPEFCRC